MKLQFELGFTHTHHVYSLYGEGRSWRKKGLSYHQIRVCWQTNFPDDRPRFDFLTGACSGLSSFPPGWGYTDKYNKKSLRHEAHPNPLHSGRDPWLLSLPQGHRCRNVLFAFLLSVNIWVNWEMASLISKLAKLCGRSTESYPRGRLVTLSPETWEVKS